MGLTGIPILIDYSATKGAIHAFTKSLALNLGKRGIRVNCVVPGPVWTPNIPGTMPIEEVENFGHEVALGRPGQPEELAPAYVLLASSDGSFATGALVEVTGGTVVERLVNQPPSTRLRSGAVETVLATTLVTDATRAALRARLEWRRSGPSVLTDAALTTLRAVCDRLIPQPFDRCVDLADRLDASLANGAGDGWRFDELPADRQAIQIGLSGIEQSARAMFGQAFPDLPPEHRDAVLTKVQNGSAPGTIWETLPAKRLFEELLGQLATLYYAEPVAQEAIGYIGMADAEGFKSIGLNRRDAIEHKASHAPL